MTQCRPEKASSQELMSQHRQFLEAAERLRAWVEGQPVLSCGAAAQRLRLPELVLLRGFLPLAAAGLAADMPPPAPLEYKVIPTSFVRKESHINCNVPCRCTVTTHILQKVPFLPGSWSASSIQHLQQLS